MLRLLEEEAQPSFESLELLEPARPNLKEEAEFSKKRVTLGIYVQRDGAQEWMYIEVSYMERLPQLSWNELTTKIEVALHIMKCGAIRHETEGAQFLYRI